MRGLEGITVLEPRDPALALAQDAARVRLGDARLWLDSITCGGTLRPTEGPGLSEFCLAQSALLDAVAIGEEWGVIGSAGGAS